METIIVKSKEDKISIKNLPVKKINQNFWTLDKKIKKKLTFLGISILKKLLKNFIRVNLTKQCEKSRIIFLINQLVS